MSRLRSNCDESDLMRASSHAVKFSSQVHFFRFCFCRLAWPTCLHEHIKQNCSINISLQVPNCFPTTNVCFLHLSFLNLAKRKTHIRDYFEKRELSVSKHTRKEKTKRNTLITNGNVKAWGQKCKKKTKKKTRPNSRFLSNDSEIKRLHTSR